MWITNSLAGDASDNIPGVLGVGPKAAADLLNLYPSLDEIYKNLPDLPEKYQKKLEGQKDIAFLSRQLVLLRLDAPVKLDFKQLALNQFRPAKIFAKIAPTRIL